MPRKTVLIYDGDDNDRLLELRTAVTIADRAALEAASSPRRFGDDDTTTAEAAQARADYDAFVDEAAARAEEWVLNSLGHEEFRALLAAHPPRTEPDPNDATKTVPNTEDAEWGVNIETFPKALLTFVDPEDPDHRTVEKPAGDTIAKRIRRLSAGEFESLWATAYMLNTGGIADPKATRFSIGRRSDET